MTRKSKVDFRISPESPDPTRAQPGNGLGWALDSEPRARAGLGWAGGPGRRPSPAQCGSLVKSVPLTSFEVPRFGGPHEIS